MQYICKRADYLEKVCVVTDEIRTVLTKVDLDSLNNLICTIFKSRKVFFTGVGRVLLMSQAAVKRLNHLGINSYYVGDIGEPPISKEDLLIVASGSGESIVPLEITKKAKTIGANIAHITSNPTSSISRISDIVVNLECPNKYCETDIMSVQPMSTLFEQSLLILFDSISLIIMEKLNINEDALKKMHANLE